MVWADVLYKLQSDIASIEWKIAFNVCSSEVQSAFSQDTSPYLQPACTQERSPVAVHSIALTPSPDDCIVSACGEQ